MIDGFDHVGTDHKCNVCQCDFTDDEGGIQGYLGILPVAFCPTCFAGLCDMVEQMNNREWEGLTEEDKNEILLDAIRHGWNDRVIVEQIEAKLKEKNYEDQD
jgi:hypothetical protein